MDNDKAFFGTILAMFALLTGHPIIALIIFIIAVM
jgi:hypothetical protein